jgi:hypothetical protein
MTDLNKLTYWSELPDGFSDAIYTDIEIHIGLLERLKVLVFGRIYVDVKTVTENKPGATTSVTRVSFLNIRRWLLERGLVANPGGAEEPEVHGATASHYMRHARRIRARIQDLKEPK